MIPDYLPTAFCARMQSLLGADASRFFDSYAHPAPRGIRIRRNAIAPERCAAHLPGSLTSIPGIADGFYLHTDARIGNSPLHHAGAFYVQEPFAMAAVAALPLTPGMRVLDLCASPGGKSTQIAAAIGEKGVLVANERVASRVPVLAGNLERMGVSDAVVLSADADTVADLFPGCFDAVVADAPCSGEGMFRKMPAAAKEWGPAAVTACATRQSGILEAAYRALRPGGYLLYSTCTFSTEENEERVAGLLARHPDLTPFPIPDPLCATSAPPAPGTPLPAGWERACRRFYPHLAPGEGQFVALMRKNAGTCGTPAYRDSAKPLTRADSAVVAAFLAEVMEDPSGLSAAVMTKGGISLPPGLPAPPADVLYAYGTRLGEIRKGRLIPHHHFFSVLGARMRLRCDLAPDDPRLAAYLRGNVFPCSLPDGWGAVLVEGVPLGGIKVTGGVAKNHYPKGLRLVGAPDSTL